VLHERLPEGLLRRELVVRAAPKPKVVDRGLATARDGHDVVVLDRATRFALMP